MVETEVMSNRFIGDGNNKTFAFGFKFNNKNDIQVWLYDSTTRKLTQRTDFTLTPNDDDMPSEGGTVTFPSEGAAIPSTQMVIVQRHMNLFQLDVYKHGMFLDLDNFEHSLDTLVLEIQQVADGVDRAIKYPINQTDFDPTLPPLKDGQTIMVNDDENGWTVIDVKTLFDKTTSAWEAAQQAANSATSSQQSANLSNERASDAYNYMQITEQYMNQGSSILGQTQDILEEVEYKADNVNVFIPYVSPAGELSWTNKAGLENPPNVLLSGEQGEVGPQGPQGVQGPKGDKGDKGDTGESGVQIETNAFCLFSVRNGHLICTYQDGTEQPNFSINYNGHLIYTIP